MKIQPRIILIIGFILVLVAPWFLTREWVFFSFNGDTGPIGDTIGGITSPIVGLLSAVLVYLAFLQQVEANKMIQTQIDNQATESILNKNFNNIFILLTKLDSDINTFHVTEERTHEHYYGEGRQGLGGGNTQSQKYVITYSGSAAISYVIASGDQDNFFSEYSQIELLLDFFETCISTINATELHNQDKKTLLFLVKQSYHSKIMSAFNQAAFNYYIDTGNADLPESVLSKKQKNISKILDIN